MRTSPDRTKGSRIPRSPARATRCAPECAYRADKNRNPASDARQHSVAPPSGALDTMQMRIGRIERRQNGFEQLFSLRPIVGRVIAGVKHPASRNPLRARYEWKDAIPPAPRRRSRHHLPQNCGTGCLPSSAPLLRRFACTKLFQVGGIKHPQPLITATDIEIANQMQAGRAAGDAGGGGCGYNEIAGVFMRQVSPCITVVRLLPGRCQTTPCRKRHAG